MKTVNTLLASAVLWISTLIIPSTLCAQENRHFLTLESGALRIDTINTIDSITIQDGQFLLAFTNGNTHSESINQLDRMFFGDCQTGLFNESVTYGTVTDIDGNTYRTVQIGNTTWMAENLRATHYSNGDALVNAVSDSDWNSTYVGAWCSLVNDVNYDCPYGKLYNSYAAQDDRNVCPSGWHVASNSDWDDLLLTADPNASLDYYPQNASDIAGGILKTVGDLFWMANTTGTNALGFSAVGAADRAATFGYIDNFQDISGFWIDNGLVIYLFGYGSHVWKSGASGTYGISIRCVQD